jgi:hypothetical protein
LIGLIAGCQNESTDNKAIPKDPETTSSENPCKEDRVVKDFKINEAPDNTTSPSEAVIQQYEISFENGKKEFPKKSSILTETTLGNNSIVAIRSLEGKGHLLMKKKLLQLLDLINYYPSRKAPKRKIFLWIMEMKHFSLKIS